jgi:fatty-acyl-CoA synthase
LERLMTYATTSSTEARLARSLLEADTSVPLRDITVGALLEEAAADAPDAVALVAGHPDPAHRERWTYAELLDGARRIARTLAGRYAPGERLAIWAPNIPEWEFVQFGAALAGLTVVTVNPALTAAELSYVLSQSRAAGIVVAAEHRGVALPDVLAEVQPRLPELRAVHPIERDGELWTGARAGAALPAVSPEAPAMIMYTSGTTGRPNGAVLAHRSLANNARFFARRLGMERGSVWINPMPMFHAAGCSFSGMGAMWCRATHVLTTFVPELVLDLLDSERGSFLPSVPTMLIALMEHPRFAGSNLEALQAIAAGSTTIDPELVRRVEAGYGARFTVIFGQTEASGQITQSCSEDSIADRTDRVGRPLEHLSVRVADPETAAVLPCGEVGELQVRGYSVMQGYFDKPAETAATLGGDGWLRTGDLGFMDDRGFVQVVGRLKDMVIRGGENVYPREIEDLLLERSDVGEVAVLGVPDDYYGEEIVAVVRAAPGQVPDATALAEFVGRRLSRHKIPKQWFMAEQLPTTPSGKIQKFRLRDAYEAGELRCLP